MPAKARQPAKVSTPAPTTAPQSSGSAPAGPGRSPQWAAGQQGTRGNEAVNGMLGQQEGGAPVADQVPKELDLQSAGLNFRLPGDTALTGDWNQLCTTTATGVWLTVSARELRVQFSPPLRVDAQWPLSDVAWSGFTYDFTQGRLTHVDVENTQIGIPIGGKVEKAVAAFVTSLVAGTPLGRGGYNPMADADLGATLKAVAGNFHAQGAGKKGGDLEAADITDIGAFASFKTRQAIQIGAGKGGLIMPAGASLDVSVAVDGTGATLPGGGFPTVRNVHLSSSDLTLMSEGKPVARLRSLRVDRGGAVDVTDFEPLGKLASLGAGESLIRLFGVLAALQGGDPRLAGGGDISPRATHQFAEGEMEKALTDAVRQLVRDHHDVVPGVDLRSVLGIEPKKGPQS